LEIVNFLLIPLGVVSVALLHFLDVVDHFNWVSRQYLKVRAVLKGLKSALGAVTGTLAGW
jgi:hypothetical protein